MNEKTFAEITDERLGGWAKRLKAYNATPLVLLAVGHAQNKGELTVCIPADVPDELIAGALRWVLKGIEQGAMPKNEGEIREWKPRIFGREG